MLERGFPQAAIDFAPKGWNAVVDTNLNGTWWMMQEAAKRWRERAPAGFLQGLRTICDQSGALLMFDAAHAFGSKSDGRAVGYMDNDDFQRVNKEIEAEVIGMQPVRSLCKSM